MLKSYAKLNIFLNIIGRENGFHLLESLFVYIDLYDELEILPSKESRLDISGAYAKELSDCLNIGGLSYWENSIFTKVYNLFDRHYGLKDNFYIKLNKQIPIGAGLGGGSSNAACFLKYLLKFYDIKISLEDQYKLASEIGADCAFFMQDRARLVSGFGEQIGPIIDIDPFNINLITPNINSNTKLVFEYFKNSKAAFSQKLSIDAINSIKNKILTSKDLLNLSRKYGNDLFEVFMQINHSHKNPINKILNENKEMFLTGTGSCLYCYDAIKKMTIVKICDKI
ncbi:MAG: 4-(cytidine 5'-diphospho)-2-C-methyl-D-erythritol kinase [Rickettsiales bacterium]|jgi:4-diphosphocytidyl-2-C-methyl-D-erythritol kinase|nr:4-(cytidine 5'-diphospho)-2-C-methyl-D-erythritol kinase [Rickettsiales bacterium]